MGKNPAVLLYTSDFLTGSALMTNEEVGAYIRVLCYQHQKGHLTEKDMNIICGTYEKDMNFMSKFCVDENGCYYNKRMEEEIDKRSKYSESRANNRKNATYDKHMNNICKTYEKHMENEKEIDNENKNDIEIDIKNEERKIKAAEREKQFSDFWDYYGKKVDSKKCREKFLKLSEPELNKIRETLPAYIKSTPEIQYRKNPLTYINGKCWNDEPVVEKSSFEKQIEILQENYSETGKGSYDDFRKMFSPRSSVSGDNIHAIK